MSAGPTEAAYEAARDAYEQATYGVFAENHPEGMCAAVNAVWPLAFAAARTQIAEEIRVGGESTCHRCGGPNVVWCAPSPLWNQVMRGGSINGDETFAGFVCPVCFAQLAEEAGIAERWRLHADRVPLETVTPSGRIWDEKTWMWRDKPECSCPDLDVTGIDDLQRGERAFIKGWGETCSVHGFNGTEPTYRKVGP